MSELSSEEAQHGGGRNADCGFRRIGYRTEEPVNSHEHDHRSVAAQIRRLGAPNRSSGGSARAGSRGQERCATVEQHGIRIEGENRVFLSPSLAAMAVTGYNTNGWVFWDYCDEQTQTWRPLDQFRSGGTEYRIVPYDASLGAELAICNEFRDGPSRHAAGYVVSNPVWRQSRAFCDEHLSKVSEEDPNLRAIWERLRADQAFHGR